MAKKSCKKGYGCGGSCISITYACKKEFPDGVSVSIEGARKVVTQMDINDPVAQKPKPKPKPEPASVTPSGKPELRDDQNLTKEEGQKVVDALKKAGFQDIYYSEPISNMLGASQLEAYGRLEDGTRYDVTLQRPNGKKPWELLFLVNGSYGADESLDRRQKLAVGRTISKAIKVMGKNLPDGMAIEVSAYNEDGGGQKRKKAYQKAGFKFSSKKSLKGRAITQGGNMIGAMAKQFKIKPSPENSFDDLDDLFSEQIEPSIVNLTPELIVEILEG